MRTQESTEMMLAYGSSAFLAGAATATFMGAITAIACKALGKRSLPSSNTLGIVTVGSATLGSVASATAYLLAWKPEPLSEAVSAHEDSDHEPTASLPIIHSPLSDAPFSTSSVDDAPESLVRRAEALDAEAIRACGTRHIPLADDLTERAAHAGKTDALSALLDAGFVHSLHLLTRYPEALQLALDHDSIEVDQLNEEERTALYCAVLLRHIQAIRLLLQHGARPELPQGKDGDTPLHLAAMKQDTDPLEALLESVTNVDVLNKSGDTPLGYAVSVERTGNANLLLNKGADPDKARHVLLEATEEMRNLVERHPHRSLANL